MPRRGPTPDFDQVTLKWAGVNLDGAPITGRLELTYNRPTPLLDDDAFFPVAIYPSSQTRALTTAIIAVEGDTGSLEDRTVGYASWRVPATDDPDIQGSGGTYTLTERLDNAKGMVRTFVASKDAPGGVIWLNRISSVTPVPGEVVSAVSVAEFVALKERVELGGGGTGEPGPGAVTEAELDAALADVVRRDGAETLDGVKTFTEPPVVPDGSFSPSVIDGFEQAVAGQVQNYITQAPAIYGGGASPNTNESGAA